MERRNYHHSSDAFHSGRIYLDNLDEGEKFLGNPAVAENARRLHATERRALQTHRCNGGQTTRRRRVVFPVSEGRAGPEMYRWRYGNRWGWTAGQAR